MSDAIFYLIFGGFFVGVGVGSFFEWGFSMAIALLVAVMLLVAPALIVTPAAQCLLAGAAKFSSKRRLPGARRLVALCLYASASFCVGLLRVEVARAGPHPLDAEIGRSVRLAGYICDEPKIKADSIQLCFAPQDSPDRIEVTASLAQAYCYGDMYDMTGKLEFPKNFSSKDGSPVFDYVAYLAKDHIRYVLYRPKATRKSGQGGDRIAALLLGVKSAIIKKIDGFEPEPQAALLAGILLGDRAAIPDDILADFKRSGLIHVVILSGYSVTLIVSTLMKALASLPKNLGRIIGVAFIVAFTVMTGATAMTVRASIMAVIAIGSRAGGRRYDAKRGLAVAAFLMVMGNPLLLVYDSAFQISLMSVIGLICLSPLFHEWLSFIPERYEMREIVVATLSTQAFVTPLIIYYMGQISVISIVPNLIALPVLPWTMGAGFLAIAASFVGGAVAWPFAWVARYGLSFLLGIVAFFGGLPFAAMQMTMSLWGLMVIYAIYIGALIIFYRRRSYSRQSAN